MYKLKWLWAILICLTACQKKVELTTENMLEESLLYIQSHYSYDTITQQLSVSNHCTYTYFKQEGHQNVVYLCFDDQLKVTYESKQALKELSLVYTDAFTQSEIAIGKVPMVQGIFTFPLKNDNPRIAIVFGDGDILQQLVKGLGTYGVATILFDSRKIQFPESYESDLYDIANAIHMVERLNVDASNIYYIAVGEQANLASTLLEEHFELSGAVLINPTQTEITRGRYLFINEKGTDGKSVFYRQYDEMFVNGVVNDEMVLDIFKFIYGGL